MRVRGYGWVDLIKNLFLITTILLLISPISAINFDTSSYSGQVSQKQVADIYTTNYTGLSTHIEPIPTGYIIDQTEPVFTIHTPTEDQNISTTDRLDFNVSYTEQYPDTCILEFNNINYTMTINTTTSECTKTIGNNADNVYTYYVWMNDTSGNSNQTYTETVTITYTASWYERTSGSGGGVPISVVTPPVVDDIIDVDLTKISPPEISDSIAVSIEISDTFSITNLDNTSTVYTISLDCSKYKENRQLCPYITFTDILGDLNQSTMIDVSIDEISKEYIEYVVNMPKDAPLTTYYADIVITSNKNETLILPIEYKTRTMLTMGEFIEKYYYLIIFVVLVGLVWYILGKRRKKKQKNTYK